MRRIERDETGFTLVELVVVVLMIGILAAIGVPAYLGQQDSANRAAVVADLAHARSAVLSRFASDDVDGWTVSAVTPADAAAAGADLIPEGWTASGLTVFQAIEAQSASDFCIVATVGAGGTSFFTDEDSAPAPGTAADCA